MSYADYVSSNLFDAADPANPMWYQPLQYIPIEYKDRGIDISLALLKPKPKPTMPDLSKFKDKLDKDLLPYEKKGIMDRFNQLEREIREELQVNPYALYNNPYLIEKFNELTTLYNSAELQSLADNKKFVVDALNKAISTGENTKLAYDPQVNEYVPATIGNIANGVLNLKGNQPYYSHIMLDYDKKAGKYRNINIPNINNGTESDFTNKLQELYSKIEKDSAKTGSKGATLTYTDAYGNTTHPAYAEGYIKSVSGGHTQTEQNYNNLLQTSTYLLTNKHNMKTLLGDNAYEGYNQLVHKTLSEGNAFNQYSNLENFYRNIEEDYKYLLNSKYKAPLKESRYKSLYETKIKPIIEQISQDEVLKEGLKRVNIQQLIYDIKVINSPKGQEAKMAVIKNNPVLQYIFYLEQQGEEGAKLASTYLDYISQLNNIAKNTVEDAIIVNNTAFNTLLNRTYSTDNYSFNDLTPHGKGYGGGGASSNKEVRTSEFMNTVRGLFEDDKLKEKTVNADEYMSYLIQLSDGKLTKEQAMQIAASDAAIADLLRYNDSYKLLYEYKNEKDPQRKKQLEEKLNKEINSLGKVKSFVGMTSIQDLERQFNRELEQKINENYEKLASEKYKYDATFNYNVKYTTAIPKTTQGGREADWYQFAANGENRVLLQGLPLEGNNTIYVNGKPLNASKYQDCYIDNSVNAAYGVQFHSPTLGNTFNNSTVLRNLYVSSSKIDDFVKEYGINKGELTKVDIDGATYYVVNVANKPTKDNLENASGIPVRSTRNQTFEIGYTGEPINTKATRNLYGTNAFRRGLKQLTLEQEE